jgi:hypothetical protein
MKMVCVGCGAEDDLRLGFCFDCATAGEERAARRTVLQHICKGVWNFVRGRFWQARFDFTWAWGRLTKTGDYASNGEFVRRGIEK